MLSKELIKFQCNKYMDIVRKHWQLLFIALATCLYFRIQLNPDLGTSLALGRYIVNTGEIPVTDPFSFSVPDHPYVHFWLSGVILYFTYQLLGYGGSTLVYSLIIAVGLWLLAETALPRLRQAWLVALIPFFIPLLSAIVGYRVQVFTFSGLALLYYIFALPPEKRKKIRLFIPPVLTLWANLHGGFILGVAFLAILLVGELKRHRFAPLLWLPVAVLATLLNPNGAEIYTQSIKMATNKVILQQAGDWASLFLLSPPSPYLFPQALAVALFVFALLLVVLLSPHSTKKEKLLASIFFGLTAYSRRYSLVFLVVAIPAFITAAEGWIEKAVSRHGEDSSRAFYAVNSTALSPVGKVLVITLFLALLSNGWRLWSKREYYTSEERYARLAEPYFVLPYGAVQYMQKEGFPSRLFNHIGWGAYLEWHFPGEKIFIDGRMDNFFVDGQPFILNYWKVARLQPGWQEVLDKYDINAVLGPPTWPIMQLLQEDPEWILVYDEDISLLFVRGEKKN